MHSQFLLGVVGVVVVDVVVVVGELVGHGCVFFSIGG